MIEELPANVPAFLDAFTEWARLQPDIEGVVLVGSYARGEPKPDSDVDLVILTPRTDQYLRDRSWLSLFGKVTSFREENYGRVTSVRSYYVSGLEVEFGFSTSAWAARPIDTGTLNVISQGMKVPHDPNGLIARMQEELNCSA